MADGHNKPPAKSSVHVVPLGTPVYLTRSGREKMRAAGYDVPEPAPKPLSPDALSVLVRSEKAPVECRNVNPGVSRKLVSEGWCDLVDVPNHLWKGPGSLKPQTVQALTITEKGKARIAFDEP